MVTISIPRAVLGGDDGSLDTAALIGTLEEPTDGAPNGGHVSTIPCSGGAGCPPTPATGCRAPTTSGRAALAIADAVDDRRDTLFWSWGDGPATPVSAFGNPRTTTGYDLCVYDEDGGAASLVLSARVPAGGLCGRNAARPCWRATQRGFAYGDREGTSAGIRKIVLDGGRNGSTAIRVQGRGLRLGPPTLPLAKDPRVMVQLHNDAGSCWTAGYSQASANTAKRFEGRGD